ncbi:MAG: glycosyltransferase [Sphingobacteriia bacterium]
MKIAFFVQYCHEAGTYFRWHNLAKALALNGHVVHVYAGDFNYKAKKRIENRNGIEYRIVPSLITSRIFGNPSDPITALYRSIQHVDNDYDVYHLFQPFLQAFLPWYFLKFRKKGKFYYDWDDLWTGGIFQRSTSLREWYTHKIVAFLEKSIPSLANSTTICSSYLKNLLLSTSNKNLLYNGFWPFSNEIKANINQIFKKENNNYYLGYIGKTAAELDWIIDAAKLILPKYPSVRFIIVGPAFSQVLESGLLSISNMQYLGEVTPSEATLIASSLDIGLLPLENTVFNQSRFPIKFFDYLSAGTPVYYSGIGELKQIGEKLNFVYEGGYSKNLWIEGLIQLVGEKIGETKPVIDIQQLNSIYSWQAIVAELEKIYQS